MMSKRETILQALHSVLLGLPQAALRDGILPERIRLMGCLSCAMVSLEIRR